MHRLAPLALAALVTIPLAATAQLPPRETGRVGAYTPPRVWPLRRHPFDLLHQRIEVAFDLPRRLVSGQVTTRLVPTGAPADSVALDAGNLTIDRATDVRGRPLRFRFDTAHVVVRLARRVQPGDTVQFTLAYHTRPERGVYLVPRRRVIWSQGEATETRNWVPTYDAANDKATWEFLVTADTGMRVLSNGRLVGVGPGRDAAHRVWHWAQENPASTYLYSVVVGRFAVLRDRWRGRPVEYWVAPDTVAAGTVAAGWHAFGETPSMIEIYSRTLGVPYPWPKYSQSAIPDFTYGGMENVSATTQTDLVLDAPGESGDRARSLVAHELAHQWFGDLTTAATWAHIWLNEGLTTYMESVHEERSRGWDAAQLNWWRQQQQAMAADTVEARPLAWGRYRGDNPIVLFFSGHVYPKGAQVAHQLRRLLGDSLFWAGMHRFLTDNAYRPVTTADFAAAFERTSGRDLDWFFDQWCYGVGYPRLRVSRRWDERTRTLTVTVEQTQPTDSTRPLFRFPVTLRVTTRDSVLRREVTVSRRRESFALPLPSAPLAFRFDEGGWLLGTVTTDQTAVELAAMARHDPEFAARNWALQGLAQLGDSAAAGARELIVANDPDPWLRGTALDQLASHPTPATPGIARAALRDRSALVREQAIVTLAAVDSTAAAAEAERLYRSDPSTEVRTGAIEVYAAAAGGPGGEAALSLLADAAAAGRPHPIRLAAFAGLARLKAAAAAGPLERALAATEPRAIRTAALGALAEQGNSDRLARSAARYLGDADPLFAVAAVQALATAGGQQGVAALRRAARAERRVTVGAALRAARSGAS